MPVSPLADMRLDIPALDRWSPRNDRISGFTIHHQAGYNAHAAATADGREVSAQYWIDSEGPIRPQVDEAYRAFTSGMAGYPAGAAADHRNVTAEVSNVPANERSEAWEIAPEALESLAALIGDVYRRYNLGPVRRATPKNGMRGVAVHRDFVPTECPGPYMMGALRDIIKRAEWWRTHPDGGKPAPAPKPAAKPKPKPKPDYTEEDEEMSEQSHAYVRDAATNGQGSIYIILNGTGKKRKISKEEWAARRGSLDPKVVDISKADLDKIPNA